MSDRRTQIAAVGGAVLGATVLFAPAADAATITVNTLADNTTAGNGQCTIREALANANANTDTSGGDCVAGSGADTLNLTGLAGTVTLGGSQLSISDTVTITGPGATTLAIDAATNSRVLYAYNNAAALTVNLSGVTITRGRAANGGAVITKGEALNLSNVVVSNSVASAAGGGVANLGGSLNLQNVQVTGNTAQGAGGGGIYDTGGALTLNNSTLSGNTASSLSGRGGALSILSTTQPTNIANSHIDNNSASGKGGALGVKTTAAGGTLTVTNTSVTGNTASGRGGGMFLYRDSGVITLDHVALDSNTSQNRGGGIFLYNAFANVNVVDSSISLNQAPSATGSGGGIFFYRSSAGVTLALTRDTIADNSANRNGGGMFFYKGSGALAVTDTTVARNTAGTSGGGIFDRGPFGGSAALQIDSSTIAGNAAGTSGGNLSLTAVPTTINNSIVANGTAPSGPDVVTAGSNVTALTFSLVENTSGTTLPSGAGDLFGLDPDLGPLGLNGGPTKTLRPANTSPVVDQGDTSLLVDQRGRVRPFDVSGITNAGTGDGSDMGSVELQSGTTLTLTGANPDSPARTRTPRFRGTAPDGADTIKIYDNSNCSGTPLGTGTVADYSSATGVLATFPYDGTYSIYAQALDGSGNQIGCTAPGFSYVVDVTVPDAPTLTRFSPSSPGPAGQPRIFGTAESAARVKIYTNAACTGTEIATALGADFATNGILLPSVATNTSQSFYATQTDPSGNVSACGGPFTYTADSTAPAGPVLGSVTPAGPANNNTPRVKGTAEAGSTVKIYGSAACSGTPLGTGTAADFASPGIQVTVADDSTTTFYATATDAAGNVSPCAGSVSYAEDSTAPRAPSLTAFAPATPSPDHTPKITGTAENGSTVKVYRSSDCTGTPVVTGTAAAFAGAGLQLPTVADGSSSDYYVTATDPTGNESGCAGPFTYVNDVNAPSAPSLTGFSPASPSTDAAPRLRGTAPTGSTVKVFTNAACTGTPVATGSAAQLANSGIALSVAADSTTDFYATATSAAGNVSGCAGPVRYVEDSTAPVAPTLDSVSPAGPANDNTPYVKGTAEAGSTVRIYTNAACTGTPAATGTAAAFTSSGIQVAPVADDSTTTFYATATDAASNVSPCAGSVTYVERSAAPVAPASVGFSPGSPAQDHAPKITGTAPSGSTVKVYTSPDCTGTPVVTGTAAAFAGPGLQLPTVSDGSSTDYHVTATDTAGNASACAGPFTYVNDSAAPGAPLLSSFSPASPSSDNTPRLKGSADAGSAIKLYTNAACTGTPVATGTAAELNGAGIAVPMASDTTTSIYATATDAANNVSACVGPITYVEDSTAPAAPTLSSFSPSSPSNANTPRVRGSAAAGTTVRLYDNSDCTGTPIGIGTASELASPGVTFTVGDDTSTDLYAVAVDTAGNVSSCAGPVTYVEDSTAPAAPALSGFTPASGGNENAPKLQGSAPAGTIVRVYTNPACTGYPVAVGTDADLASPGITLGVGDNTTTTFYVTATDAAGNESPCSAPATYREQTPLAVVTVPVGSPGNGSANQAPPMDPEPSTGGQSPSSPSRTDDDGDAREVCAKMPKLTKHSLAYALRLIERTGCGDVRLVIKGKAKHKTPIVHAQTPKAGTRPKHGATITITIR